MVDPLQNEAARLRMDRALELIESAQNQLARALAELSPITNGGLPLWNKGSRVHDQVKAYWYKVDAVRRDQKKAGRLGVDYDPAAIGR